MIPSHLQALYQQAMAEAKDRYDPDMGLVASGSMGEAEGVEYRPAGSLPYAYALLGEGDDASIEIANTIITAVLDSQELNSEQPHYGNFKWLAGDPEVADLNAVQFVLRGLLPLLIQYDHMLPNPLRNRCQEAVLIALGEEERLNVTPTYTNIHLMSLLGLLLGGQWLENSHFSLLGIQRWQQFVEYTVRSGAPHEYNSPNYGGVDLSTLATIAYFVQDPLVRLQAKLLYERFWLHLALHLHMPTGQHVGPHCRCYWLTMTSGHSSLGDLVWRATGWDQFLHSPPGFQGIPMESLYALELLLTEHEHPGYLFPWLERQSDLMPYEVKEVANAELGDDLMTFFSPNYSLGTASQTYRIGTDCFYIEHQANYLMLHYSRPEQTPSWGMVYSRYVVNDRHWNTLGAASDRPKDANFYDQGHFAGVQVRNKAIGLYALKPQHEEVFSLKTVVVFQSGETLDSIWVNDLTVDLEALPCTLQVGDWLIIKDGAVFVGVRALEPSNLGRGSDIQLERGPLGELWLTISNYRGAPKRFWDYASLEGAFWRGNLKAGYIIEVADQLEFESVSRFFQHLQNTEIHDTTSPNHIRSVTYLSADDHLRLDYDLWHTRPAGRWLNGVPYQPDGLQSPLAVQGKGGRLQCGQASLTTHGQPVWLISQEVIPEERVWIAVNPQDHKTPLRLETPVGTLRADQWGLGRIAWHAPVDGPQKIIITGAIPVNLQVPAGIPVIQS